MSTTRSIQIITTDDPGEQQRIISRLAAEASQFVSFHVIQLHKQELLDQRLFFTAVCRSFMFSEYYGYDLRGLHDMLVNDPTTTETSHLVVLQVPEMRVNMSNALLQYVLVIFEHVAAAFHARGRYFEVYLMNVGVKGRF